MYIKLRYSQKATFEKTLPIYMKLHSNGKKIGGFFQNFVFSEYLNFVYLVAFIAIITFSE